MQQELEAKFFEIDPADVRRRLTVSFLSHPSVQFDPVLHPRIERALNRISEAADEAATNQTPMSFSQLELLRRVARTAANSTDKDERRLGYQVIQQIDDFVDAPPANAIVAGSGPDAAQAVQEARRLYRQRSQADALEGMVTRASNSAEGLTARSLRQQARNVANSANRMRSFDPAIQQQITNLARGKGGLGAVQSFGNLAPSTEWRWQSAMAPAMTLGTGASFYAGSPGLGATGATLLGASLAARAKANRMASNRMQSMIDQATGTPPRYYSPAVGAQIAQQGLRTTTGAVSPDTSGITVSFPNAPEYSDVPAGEGMAVNVTYDPAEWDENGNYIGPR